MRPSRTLLASAAAAIGSNEASSSEEVCTRARRPCSTAPILLRIMTPFEYPVLRALASVAINKLCYHKLIRRIQLGVLTRLRDQVHSFSAQHKRLVQHATKKEASSGVGAIDQDRLCVESFSTPTLLQLQSKGQRRALAAQQISLAAGHGCFDGPPGGIWQ